jgi:hypothetical protein
MKKKCFVLGTFWLCSCALLNAAGMDALYSKPQEASKIIINNRILAQVNGKLISTYDVTKKMDMLFYKQYPQYLTVLDARYQYYLANWKYVLDELINKELVLADAKELKIEASGGDVRQEMESSFGPNIIENLDKAGITFDEAAKIMQGDIVIRRMVNMRVNVKALRAVTPATVRQAYEEFIQEPKNARLTEWRYRVITVSDRTPQRTEETADKAYRMLIEQRIPLDKLAETMKAQNLLGRKGKVTVSDEIFNNEQELSDVYRETLKTMEPGMISQPAAHKSRTNQSTVYRIFYVKDKVPGGMPSFQEMEGKLKEELLNQAADKETELYLNKLRQHFHIREQDINVRIPADYQPFMLK